MPLSRQVLAAYRAGDWSGAERLCKLALAQQPGDAMVLSILGFLAARTGRLTDAAKFLGRAVAASPMDIAARSNYGAVLQQLGRLGEALECYEHVIRLQPDLAEAHSNRGLALMGLARLDEALESCSEAVALDPRSAEAHNNLGMVLQEIRRFDEALSAYERAIALKPGLADAHSNRGHVLRVLNRAEEALKSCDEAIQLQPAHVEAHNNRGAVLWSLRRLDEAIASFDYVIQLKPDHPGAHSNRGIALGELGRHDEAIASFDRALSLYPEFADANFNKALTLLRTGDFVRGWPLYEWRWKRGYLKHNQGAFAAPLWLGDEPIAGKEILLHSEQGFGDTIQFCRLARCVAQRGGRVILEVPAQLAALLATLDGVAELRSEGARRTPVDYHCPLMSLPLALGVDISSIPDPGGYLRADPARRETWRRKLGKPAKPRVGIVWAGGFRPGQPETWSVNERRNVALAKFARFLDIDAEFFSLQKVQSQEQELQRLQHANWPGPRIIDETDALQDFADTAALVDNLDLVISVDSAVAHLAGALGKPVWVLSRFDGCWRWLVDREDSPWYSSARLYRQRRPGDWDEVLDRVKSDLRTFCASLARN